MRHLALRAGTSPVRTGSVFGHGSGDTAPAFSTTYTVSHEGVRVMSTVSIAHGPRLDLLLRMVADNVKQAIIHALFHATAITGHDGNTYRAPTELLWPDAVRILISADIKGVASVPHPE